MVLMSYFNNQGQTFLLKGNFYLLSHELHFFLRIFLLIAGVNQGTEETERLVFDGICLSAAES